MVDSMLFAIFPSTAVRAFAVFCLWKRNSSLATRITSNLKLSDGLFNPEEAFPAHEMQIDDFRNASAQFAYTIVPRKSNPSMRCKL